MAPFKLPLPFSLPSSPIPSLKQKKQPFCLLNPSQGEERNGNESRALANLGREKLQCLQWGKWQPERKEERKREMRDPGWPDNLNPFPLISIFSDMCVYDDLVWEEGEDSDSEGKASSEAQSMKAVCVWCQRKGEERSSGGSLIPSLPLLFRRRRLWLSLL